MNPFISAPLAAQYARGRPFYHPLVMARIGARLGLREPVPLALDVGCGVGLSTLALAEIAERVLGVDPSAAMLAQASAHPRVVYRQAAAEALPVADGDCALVAVASAFHLFDRGAFLGEAHRALAPGGWLVLYDNALTGEARGIHDFRGWLREVYLPAYPPIPGNRAPLVPAEAAAFGFRFAGEEAYANTVRFTSDELCDYLLAQANCAAALDVAGRGGDDGGPALDGLRRRLREQLAPRFGRRGHATVRFRGAIRYLQRADG